MCGIFGRVGRGPAEQLRKLAIRSEVRGRDAGGIAWRDGDSWGHIRRPGAIRRVLRKLPSGALNSDIIIGHTRMATSGPASDNINNHPFTGRRWIIVHNGFVYNPEVVPCESMCDSEAILRVLEKHKRDSAETAVRASIEKLDGLFAVAAIDRQDPCHVYLWRDSNPIWYAVLDNCVVFASEWNFIQNTYLGSDAKPVPANHLVRMGRRGITHAWELPEKRWTSCTYWHGGKKHTCYTPVHDDYESDWPVMDTQRLRALAEATSDPNDGVHRVPRKAEGRRFDSLHDLPIAWYSDYTFDVYCPPCAAYLMDDIQCQMTPIYGEKHWLLQEVHNNCQMCGDPIF